MTCNSPFLKDTLADQAWKHYSGCKDKPKEEPRYTGKHEPITGDLKHFKKKIMQMQGCTEEEILKECGLID